MTQESLDKNPIGGGFGRSGLPYSCHPRYREYKHSGIEWLGQIPCHWKVTPVNRVYTVQLGKMLQNTPNTSDDVEVPYLKAQHVQWFHVDTRDAPMMWASPTDVARFGLAKGDLLVCEGGEGGRCGILNHDSDGFIIQNALHRVRAREPGPKSRNAFLQYVMTSIAAAGWTDALNEKATIAHFTKDKFESLRVPIPPLDEQDAIAGFLDRETAKIDALVAKKERQIELLQEKRTALITRAVTKGLDPDVPMRDSGIELLRRIPAHWHVKRLRDIADSLQTGPFGSQLHADDYTTHGTPVINPVNLVDGGLVPDFECTVDAAIRKRLQHHQLCCGDILFARRGEIGRCGLVTGQQEGWLCGTGCLRMRTKSGVAEPLFLLYGFSTGSIRGWLEIESVGSTMQNLNTSIIGRVPVAIPDLDEQRNLLKVLALETGRIDDLMASVREAIERLKELRTALISAAVTGKIDVRDAADANPRTAS